MTAIEPSTLLAIAGMAVVTYCCRAAGVLLFRQVKPSPRMAALLQNLPGTLFIAYVVPTVLRAGPVQWVGAAATVAVMAATRSLAGAILAGVAAAWLVWASR